MKENLDGTDIQSESMMGGEAMDDRNLQLQAEASRRMKIEALLDKLNVTGSLRNIVGALPPMTDEEIEQAKYEYFKEKYGL